MWYTNASESFATGMRKRRESLAKIDDADVTFFEAVVVWLSKVGIVVSLGDLGAYALVCSHVKCDGPSGWVLWAKNRTTWAIGFSNRKKKRSDFAPSDWILSRCFHALGSKRTNLMLEIEPAAQETANEESADGIAEHTGPML